MRHRWAVGAGYPVCKKLARSRKRPVDQTFTAATTVRLGVISPPTTSYLECSVSDAEPLSFGAGYRFWMIVVSRVFGGAVERITVIGPEVG
jgi:hypothetical protein